MVYYDPGSLPFLVDELVAMATVEVVVTPTSPAAVAHEKLAPAVRKRVRVLSTASLARRRLEGFLSPLNVELGSELRSQTIHVPRRVPQPMRVAVGVVYFFLYDFLLIEGLGQGQEDGRRGLVGRDDPLKKVLGLIVAGHRERGLAGIPEQLGIVDGIRIGKFRLLGSGL